MGKMYKNRTPAEAFGQMPGKKMMAEMKSKKAKPAMKGKTKKMSTAEKFDAYR